MYLLKILSLTEEIFLYLESFLWGFPLLIFIMSTGIYLSFKLRFIQIFKLKYALKLINENALSSDGDISSFGALCTALSATIGTGNIIGVATAVTSGGPGALFWMFTAAFFGMAVKYAEGFLAVKYREQTKSGKFVGGPFFYIEKGLGKWARPLARFFAVSCLCASVFGLGTFIQINSIITSANDFFDGKTTRWISDDITLTTFVLSITVTLAAAYCIYGGIKRISKVSKLLIPSISILYVGCCTLLIILNISKLPSAITLIVKSAFNPKAALGALTGIGFKEAISKGISRGIFSNEAGLGTAPIAAASARTTHAVKQGLVSMTGTFFDTIIICTMTGLSIIITDSCSYSKFSFYGSNITAKAFSDGLMLSERISSFIVMLCLVVFAFTTIIGWNFYGERCLDYLFGEKNSLVHIYRAIYIMGIFFGAYLSPQFAWTVANVFNALMAFPNLVALLLLSPIVIGETKFFLKRK